MSRESNKRPYNQTGLYIKVDAEALDGRTTVAKLIKELKHGLQDYVGESTIASELLIQRIIYKHIRLSAYENAFIEHPKNEEKQHYLPMANSLRLDLIALQQLAGESEPPNLKSYIAERGNTK